MDSNNLLTLMILYNNSILFFSYEVLEDCVVVAAEDSSGSFHTKIGAGGLLMICNLYTKKWESLNIEAEESIFICYTYSIDV